MNSLVLTVAEIAKIMKISKPTAYAEIHRNDGIPHIKIGRKILIPKDKFAVWLNTQTEQKKNIRRI